MQNSQAQEKISLSEIKELAGKLAPRLIEELRPLALEREGTEVFYRRTDFQEILDFHIWDLLRQAFLEAGELVPRSLLAYQLPPAKKRSLVGYQERVRGRRKP
jgi:hypothetical protein